ncbi:AraC family transcriptional regulator [Reichenbachiella versicolor]|uniref:AraC family transcriptional regulator n=1 Tax=Reichenbachiella versicolor TaxID=1821036 RepID=UPI000D6DDCA9|nr:AraC family transcriptional regulator [Reichenbachiella versicolor]
MIQYFEIDSKASEDLVSSPLAPRKKEYHEIMWVQEGDAGFIIDGDFFNVKAPAFFILPKDRIHQFLPKEAIVGQVIRFSESSLDDFPRLLFSKFSYMSEVKIDENIAAYFGQLFSLFKTEYVLEDDRSSVIIHLLKTIIYKLDDVKRLQFPQGGDYGQSIDLFDRFQLLMDEHIKHNRSVSFYADLLNITPRKLGEVIKSLFQTTTENIISQRLLIEAKRQLSYSDQSVMEVAYSLNFQDNSYFTKFFKKLTNITPKQFRQQQ